MLRALFRKQAMAFAAFFIVSGRDGRRRSRGMILAWSLLALYLAAVLAGLSAMNAWGIFSALLPMDLGWLAFALTGLGAVAASSVCCAFFAWSGIYQARDNELLLSLPIPAWQILLSRVSWLYLMALALTAGMFLPAAAIYQILAGFRPLALACCLLLTLTLPLLAAALSCLIGWLIALAAARVRRKAPVVVTLSLLGIAGLYWGVFQLQSALGALAVFCAAAGLGANLLWPNLTWTSETVAVKQGIGTMAGMLAPLIWLLALAGLYLALGRVLGTGGYLLLAAGLTAVLAALALGWVLRRGAARWEAL